jgi:predicted secreted protein
MPTFRHGKNSVFKVDNSGGTLTDISNVLNNVSMPREIETVETTSFGSSYRTYVVGFQNATISVEGTWDATVDAHLAGILGQDATVSFEYGPEGSSAGYIKYTGEAYVTSYETSGAVGEVVTFSAELQVSGAITRGTYS